MNTIDFRYISDVLTPQEAVQLLEDSAKNKNQREEELIKNGYPAYTTQVGKKFVDFIRVPQELTINYLFYVKAG